MHPSRIARFMRASSQLNKQPKVSTDFFDDPILKKKGQINRDEQVSMKPARIPKKLAHQKQATTFKGTMKKSAPPRKGRVGNKYK